MKLNSPTLFVEINKMEYIFSVGDKIDQENFKLIHQSVAPIQGISSYKIVDYNLVLNIIKKNIYEIEQQLNFTFKEVVLIIDNFECLFINLTGFKKLNGSQILKENITYILNTLKSYVSEVEDKKTILHIFNSKYSLDSKNITNLPIGLFGDFYFHELSFCLMNNSDYKNLNNIFTNCNLKIKKILLKSFVEGSFISNNNSQIDTFFQIKINKNNCHLFYFENNALKFEENFEFGSDIVIKDISKITSLETQVINKFLQINELNKETSDKELVEEKFFENKNYRKIKKKLILDIAEARIKELSEVLVSKNINLKSINNKNKVIYLQVSDKLNFKSFKDCYLHYLSENNTSTVNYIDSVPIKGLIKNANQLVHFGWKKEAIPVAHPKKTIIARFFDIIFS